MTFKLKVLGVILILSELQVFSACSQHRGNMNLKQAQTKKQQSNTLAKTVNPNQAEDFRHNPPINEAPPLPLTVPNPKRTTLANGLTLYHLERQELPLIHLRLVLKSGRANCAQEQVGLAELTAMLLKSGTTTRNAAQLAQEIESYGTNLAIQINEEHTSLAITSLSNNFPAIYEIVSDMLLHPTFLETEIEKVRKQHLAALAHGEADPQDIADKLFKQAIFGEHPYGYPAIGTKKSLAQLQQKDIQNYFKTHFRPEQAAVIIVGNISFKEAEELTTKFLAAWTSHPSAAKKAPPLKNEPLFKPLKETLPRLLLNDQAQTSQTILLLGHLGPKRATPDYYKLLIYNAILGGLFNSRINMRLREDKGYTYGAYSSFAFLKEGGDFAISTSVKNDTTFLAIKDIYQEIKLMNQELVNDQEFMHAKNRYILSLPAQFQNLSSIANMFSNIYAYDLPIDYYQTLPEKIKAVTKEDVLNIGKKYVHPEQLKIVAVGSQELLLEKLKELKDLPLEIYDAEGHKLKEHAAHK